MPTRSNLGAKDYELIAAVLSDSDSVGSAYKTDLAFEFADRLVATSDSFDPLRFIQDATGAVYSPEIVGAYSPALRLRVKALEARRSHR